MNRRNVIVVATEAPDLTGGAPVRNYHLIRQLVRAGRSVTLICLSDKPAENERQRLEQSLGITAVVLIRPALNAARALGTTLHQGVPPYYIQSRRSSLMQMLAQTAAATKPAYILLEELEAYYAVMPVLQPLQQNGAQIVLDAHNIEWHGFEQTLTSFSLPKRLIGKYITPALRRLEEQAARTVDTVLVCSSVDQEFFGNLSQNVHVVPNGVDCSHFSQLKQPSPAPRLLFMGGTKYPPNADAIHWYLDHIHPHVKASVPDVTFTILGGTPPAWLQHYANIDASIELPGFVPDVRTYLAKAAVCICPVRIGSGTRLKVLEYMGSGKAIVSTTKGAEGLSYEDGKHLLVADAPDAIAQAIVQLLRNQPYREEIGNNALALAQREYDWQVIGDKLTHALPIAEDKS